MTADEREVVLDRVEDEALKAAFQMLARGRVAPTVWVVGEGVDGAPHLGSVPVLDLRDRDRAIEQGLRSVPGPFGFVFVFDGFVRSPTGRDQDAMLLVRVSEHSGTGQAWPYLRAHFGLVKTDGPIDPPDGVVPAYRAILDRVRAAS